MAITDGSGIAQKVVKSTEFINDTVGQFLPIVSGISILTKEIAEAYENAQYNKKTCGILVYRVEAAEVAIKKIIIERDENIDKFRSQDYNKSFKRFVTCLENIKDFCNDISRLSKFKKFFTSRSIKEKFQEIIREFDCCSSDLNLAISVTTKEEMNRHLTSLHADMFEMKKFLDKIGGGITFASDNIEKVINNAIEIKIQNQKIITEISNIEFNKGFEPNKKTLECDDKQKSLDFNLLNSEIETISEQVEQVVNNQNLKLGTAKQIQSSDLNLPHVQYSRKGNRVTIQKKVYQAMDVATKPISDIKNIQKQLAILEKLNVCPQIIQFYGLSEINKEHVMVFEWAEYGTLRELYRKYDNIPWNIKISIARDICRGLAFLHSVSILHHDVKCENILIGEKMQPKISNFSLSREFDSETQPVDSFNDIIHWLAPEKLKHLKDRHRRQEEVNRYTIQCEIFSFAMLLWELGFQKKPYENMSLTGILEHVLKGGRESFDFESNSDLIKKEYCAIIKRSWIQEPSLRPEIRDLFNSLQELYENHNILPLLHQKPSQSNLISFPFFVYKIFLFVVLLMTFFSSFSLLSCLFLIVIIKTIIK